ncbi:hypothetical protein [Micromonospora lutea]|uniref:Condensation domain-containing protein n=1 Tax=Micromonospora lutea TaxID=419825 RepID=A0ABQ4IT14_9ACTN|nr:hypothetical protein [Micromonospora lutea]GIJ21064.1 hypothetical protein Vlu01_16880 [Micromonospora lutea]
MTCPRPDTSREASYLQDAKWPHRHGATGILRALRICGELPVARLRAAVTEVSTALPVLTWNAVVDGARLRFRPGTGPTFVELATQDGESAAVALLRAERDRPVAAERDAMVRFLFIRCGPAESVLGLVADELLLDERAVYHVLAAVMECYAGRFRPEHHRDITTMATFEPLTDAARANRRTWWSRWLAAGPANGGWVDAADGWSAETVTRRLDVPGPRWRALAAVGGTLRDNGSMAVLALVAWALRDSGPDHGAADQRAVELATVLDLRDILGLGDIVGPLTDRVVLRVDLPSDAGAGPSFRELLRRAQAGLLRSVTHYLPYPELIGLGLELELIDPVRPAARWGAQVHLCRNPPRSGPARDAGTAEVLGAEVELFRESDLLAGSVAPSLPHWDGSWLNIHIGESDGGTAVLAEAMGPDAEHHADRLVRDLGWLIEQAEADPDAPLTTNAP